MADYRSIAEVKAYAAQMLSEEETSIVLAGSTAAGTHDMLSEWVKSSFDRFATWGNHRKYEDTIELTWGSGSGQNGAILYLPNYISRILSIFPQESSEGVDIVDAYEFDRVRPHIRERDYLVEHGYYSVEGELATAGAITAVSDIAADADDGLQVRLEGLTNASPGYEIIETLTLSSSTATSTNTFKAGAGGIRSINIVPGTVPAAGGGIITVTGGGATLERLDASRERMHEHIRTELFAPIGGTGTYTVRYYRRPFNVTTSTDLIPMPGQFHDILELGIMKHLEMFRGNAAGVIQMEAMWMQRMREYMAWNNRRPGQRKVLHVVRQWG